MTYRVPTILAVLGALVVVYNGHAGLGANAIRGINASGGWDPTLRAAHVVPILNVKYT
jgi:hypothetical protein